MPSAGGVLGDFRFLGGCAHTHPGPTYDWDLIFIKLNKFATDFFLVELFCHEKGGTKKLGSIFICFNTRFFISKTAILHEISG